MRRIRRGRREWTLWDGAGNLEEYVADGPTGTLRGIALDSSGYTLGNGQFTWPTVSAAAWTCHWLAGLLETVESLLDR